MGIGSRTKAWRFTDINKDYSVCVLGFIAIWAANPHSFTVLLDVPFSVSSADQNQ